MSLVAPLCDCLFAWLFSRLVTDQLSQWFQNTVDVGQIAAISARAAADEAMQIVDIAIAVTTRAWQDHKMRVELEARRRKAEGLILTEAQVGCTSGQTSAAATTASYWHSFDTQAYMK
jgi:hypothetical protein